MHNMIGRFVDKSINILYARPADIKDDRVLTNITVDDICVYDMSQISDISWFHYDILLTHQVNNQIIGLSKMLHIPILCVPLQNIPTNTINEYVNCISMPDGSSVEEIISMCRSLKYKRFII